MAFSSSTVTIGANTKKSDYDRLLDNTQYNKATRDNDVTLAGKKTFSSTATFSSDVNMSGTVLTGIKTDGTFLKTKIIALGVWNMDSIDHLDLTHGLTLSKIRNVSVSIINDAETYLYAIEYISSANSGGYWRTSATEVEVIRLGSGFFDSTDFNDGAINRGYITILYEI